MTGQPEPSVERAGGAISTGDSDPAVEEGRNRPAASGLGGSSPRSRTARSRSRRWAFRLAAVALGLSVFGLLELLLLALGVGDRLVQEDPFVGFRSVRPLFVPSDDGRRREIPPPRQTYFAPAGFPAVKPADEFRIFCLGGSTVQGRPYSTETSFTRWLEIALNAADSSRSYRVVNCGGVSYASYRLVPILDEVLRYQPDLILVYTGHNEFLEDRTYGHLKRRGAATEAALAVACRLRTYCLLRSLLVGSTAAAGDPRGDRRTRLPDEVEAILDYRGGLDQYQRDDAWREQVIRHFRWNLQRMIATARDAGVPLILADPVSNLRDCPPFKSEPSGGLSPARQQASQELWRQARERYATDLAEAVRLLARAAAIDPENAALHYQLAECYDALGQVDQARRHYVRAKEQDICPLRMLEPMHDILAEVCRQSDSPLVPVRRRLEGECRGGIADDSVMADHVHPSIRGHQLIALEILDAMIAEGWVQPRGPWRETYASQRDAHLQSLDPLYFAKGRRRLEGLKRWTRGESKLEKPPQSPARPGQPRSAAAESAVSPGPPPAPLAGPRGG